MKKEIRQGDCIEAMRELDESSIDAVVCDPPYGLEFMGKEWDRLGGSIEATRTSAGGGAPVGRTEGLPNGYSGARVRFGATARQMQDWHYAWATEALRVLKPGGHLLAFGGTRTYHRLACAVEDAGFEIRDSVIWLYGSGFPKSLDVSKAIDKAGGAEGYRAQEMARGLIASSGLSNAEIARHLKVDSRLVQFWRDGEQRIARDKFERLRSVIAGLDEHPPEGERQRLGTNPNGRQSRSSITNVQTGDAVLSAPATPEAEQWQGWGTALKPAHEPIVVARKPLIGTVAQNVQEHGTGALNVDGCRVGTTDALNGGAYTEGRAPRAMAPGGAKRVAQPSGGFEQPSGRWPANVVLDEESARLLDEQTGDLRTNPGTARSDHEAGLFGITSREGKVLSEGDSGGASRFFYCAKSSRAERNAGLEGFEERARADQSAWYRTCNVCGQTFERSREPTCGHNDFGWAPPRATKNAHPTVKPIALMRWLCRLVTPLGGLILDPFAGSGTTGCAAILEGFDFLGIEREAEYVEIANARIAHWASQPVQLGLEAA